MRYMIMVRANADSEAGGKPSEELIAEMADYHQELAKAGALRDASGLAPSSRGWRIRYSEGKRTVVDHQRLRSALRKRDIDCTRDRRQSVAVVADCH